MSDNTTKHHEENHPSHGAVNDYVLPEENDQGNAEYKYYILPASADRFDRLVTQLRWRLNEGEGSCVYEIGVLDDGTLEGITMSRMRESLSYLCAMAQVLGAQVTLRRLLYRRGTTLYAIKSRDEAYRELKLDQGLPCASIVRTTPPSDMLQIDLLPSPPWEACVASEDQSSHDVSMSRRHSDSRPIATEDATGTETTLSRHRRTLRLARYEAAIREGAGCTQRQTSYRHHGPLRQPCPSDGLDTKWCAEMTLQHEGFFVDYSLLPC